MKDVTIQDLENWAQENGEDVILDGPCYLTDEQDSSYMKQVMADNNLINKMTKAGELEECLGDEELTPENAEIHMFSYSSKYRNELMKHYADFLNTNKIDFHTEANNYSN